MIVLGLTLEACVCFVKGWICKVEDQEGLWIQLCAMSMRILVQQLNGETFELEITPEMTMRAVKEQLKRMHKWEDELSRDTTLVEMILGDRKVMNDETVEELGLCDGSKVTVVFRKNVVQCSNKGGLGPNLDPDALVIVEIPDLETEIKAWAFEDCAGVAKVIIPSTVTRIGDAAFNGCRALAAINIPDTVTQIGGGAFAGCSALAAVNIPDSVTQIGWYAFCGCASLVTINIPSCVTQVGAEAFYGCSSMFSVDIPDSVTEIFKSAFNGCKRLTLTAPARLLGPHVSDVCKFVAKECGCGRCDWTWFRKGWVCPVHFSGQ